MLIPGDVCQRLGSGGSDNGDDAQELTGQFIDSAVSGIRFVTSGGGQGTTDSNGTFTYRTGETVQFYIGDIYLGEATGAAMITPLDLVPGAQDTSNPMVQNIARLLQSLDDNNVPADGITISQAVRDATTGLSIDFSATDFDSRATSLLQTIYNGVGMTPPPLVTASSAELHMRGTLLGNMAGTYRGSFLGNVNGSWEITVTSDGRMTVSIDPDDPTLDSMMAFPTLNIDGSFSGDGMTGRILADGSVSGNWDFGLAGQGTFQGSRVTGGDNSGGGELGSLTLSGPDTASFLVSRFEPSSGGPTMWFDVDVANRASRTVGVLLGNSGNVIFAGFVAATQTELWSYTLDCINNTIACINITLDRTTRTVQFNNAILPPTIDDSPSEDDPPNSATAPIVLNGTLGYTESTAN